MLWGMGLFITLFFLYTQFNEHKSDLRQQFHSGYENLQVYIQQSNATLRLIHSMTRQQKLKDQEYQQKMGIQQEEITLPTS
ncbi:hypothetical protein, partial [Escherichia coli]